MCVLCAYGMLQMFMLSTRCQSRCVHGMLHHTCCIQLSIKVFIRNVRNVTGAHVVYKLSINMCIMCKIMECCRRSCCLQGVNQGVYMGCCTTHCIQAVNQSGYKKCKECYRCSFFKLCISFQSMCVLCVWNAADVHVVHKVSINVYTWNAAQHMLY